MGKVYHESDYLHGEKDVHIHESLVEGRCELHTHDFIEMGVILSGSGVHRIGRQTFAAREGEVFLLNAQTQHEFIPADGSCLLVRNYIFSPAAAGVPAMSREDFVHEQQASLPCSMPETQDYIRLTERCSPPVITTLDEIRREYDRKELGYLRMIHADLSRLMVQLLRQQELEMQHESVQSFRKREIVDHALYYIKLHYAEHISCDMLAAQCFLSVNYFNRIFKEITGSSVVKTLQKYRLSAAEELLRTTDYSVNEIANQVGYSDMKCFYQLFHRKNGCTPKEYRDYVAAASIILR